MKEMAEADKKKVECISHDTCAVRLYLMEQQARDCNERETVMSNNFEQLRGAQVGHDDFINLN